MLHQPPVSKCITVFLRDESIFSNLWLSQNLVPHNLILIHQLVFKCCIEYYNLIAGLCTQFQSYKGHHGRIQLRLIRMSCGSIFYMTTVSLIISA